MKKINDAQWCAQDLIQSAFLMHAGSQNEFFTLHEQEALNSIRQALEGLNKKIIDLMIKKPNPEFMVDTAIEDLEAILSKDLDDAFFDMGLDVQDVIDEVVNDLEKISSDDL